MSTQALSALDKLRKVRELEEVIEKAGKINDVFLAVAKEKDPTRNPEAILEEVMTAEAKVLLQPDTDYKTKLDMMAADLGEHFAPIRTNANFQEIFEKWCKDYGERQYKKMLSNLSAWTDGKVTAEDVDTLMKAAAASLQMQASGMLD